MTRGAAGPFLAVIALAALAVTLHGYHFGIEDQTLYLPAIERALDPTLFPHDAVFFVTETRFTLFDEAMAYAVRWSGIPLDFLVAGVHFSALVLVLAACRRIAIACGIDRSARWAGLLLIAIALPMPVAGTRLGLMEQYLHPRGLAIALMLWAFVASINGRVIAAPLVVVAGLIHPLTALWGTLHVVFQLRNWRWRHGVWLLCALVTLSCNPLQAPPADTTNYWREALSPQRFDVRYPLNWSWYEWLGVVGPIALLAYFVRSARQNGNDRLATMGARLLASGVAGVVLAIAVTAVPDRRLPLQPMRELHLLYFVTFLLGGAQLERKRLRGRWPRRLGVFVPLVLVVLAVQRHFPSSPHVEWPGRPPDNAWARAFLWSRDHTPKDALFATDPFYLRRPGPDSHSLRALAERSMLSEAYHDLAPAAMSVELGRRWMTEQQALANWGQFTKEDFVTLRRQFGVTWVVVAQPRLATLDCPFENQSAAVCRLGDEQKDLTNP
jgi:hypothetical protein